MDEYMQRMKEECPEQYDTYVERATRWEEREARMDYSQPVIVPTRVDLADELLKEDPLNGVWSFDRWNKKDIMKLLVRISCPAPCKGYSTPPENWHQLCEDRARRAFNVLMDG